MVKRVFIIHGWDGYPEEGWFPWLKKELEKVGFKVEVPLMPDKGNPKIEKWVSFLTKLVKNPNKDTCFVGHSIGCQTILRYLEKLPENSKIGGCVFVAGWFNLKNLETKEEREVAKPWLKTLIKFDKIKKITKNFVAIFSDNDEFVPIEDSKIFKSKLGAEIIVEHNKGHFSGSDNVKELPAVLELLLKFSSN